MVEGQESLDSEMTTKNLIKLKDKLSEVELNLYCLQQEWQDLQQLISATVQPHELMCRQDVIVSKSTLHKMSTEMNQMKMLLPKVVSKTMFASVTKSVQIEQESEKVKQERDGLKAEVVHWKNQLVTAVANTHKEKQLQLDLQVTIKDLTDQLSQQSEFSFSLGSVCCTLLWRLSRQEDCIHTIVSGSKSAELLALVSSSVSSYLISYVDDQWPDQDTDEAAFLLALCGTMANIAASALGREHMASSAQGQMVIDTFITFIKDAPIGKSANMKSLMLMCLYNISINQKGVNYLYSKSAFIPMLCWHLKEESNTDNRVNTLRLLHSLISDETRHHAIHELNENLPLSQLQQLTTSCNKDIQNLSLDIIMDIRQLDTEQ